jgi:hypothetical protein
LREKAITFSIITFSIKALSIKALSIMTFSIKTLSIITFSICWLHGFGGSDLQIYSQILTWGGNGLE